MEIRYPILHFFQTDKSHIHYSEFEIHQKHRVLTQGLLGIALLNELLYRFQNDHFEIFVENQNLSGFIFLHYYIISPHFKI